MDTERKRGIAAAGLIVLACASVATVISVVVVNDSNETSDKKAVQGSNEEGPPNVPTIEAVSEPSMSPRISGYPSLAPMGAPAFQNESTSAPGEFASPAPTASSDTAPDEQQPMGSNATMATNLDPSSSPSGPPTLSPVATSAVPLSSSSPNTTSISQEPSVVPFTTPTVLPTISQTNFPSSVVTDSPSSPPLTSLPTFGPTNSPSIMFDSPSSPPLSSPTSSPINQPTFAPISQPTGLPTTLPTTSEPSSAPLGSLTSIPTMMPSGPPTNVAKTLSFTLIDTVAHDSSAFTQGLVFTDDGRLFEGTGLYGRSSIRRVDLLTGDVLDQTDLSAEFFGEGVAYDAANDRLIQLTWKESTAFIYDAATLTETSRFTFSSTNDEGWGITKRNNEYYVSDGSSFLHIWDEETFEELRRVQVTIEVNGASPRPIDQLNELEWDPRTDTILANVWQTNDIVCINPLTGVVTTIYDLSNLYTDRSPFSDVLNGIAIEPQARSTEVWVTGKLWPFMYLVELN